MWSAIVGAWHLLWAIRKFKKDVEADANKALSESEAKRFRLALEKLFVNLEDGHTEDLPKWLHWACQLSTVDEQFGTFGQHVLKSEKIEKKDPVLYRPH